LGTIGKPFLQEIALRTSSLILVCSWAFALLGCGSGGPKGINVGGQATLDGVALTRGDVVLVAEEGAVVRQGTIQNDGTFTVPDIPPGRYKVALRIDPFSEDDYDVGEMGKKTLKKNAKAVNIPPKLQDATQSGMSIEVENGKELVVEFKSK
jgi:hypothetical protein